MAIPAVLYKFDNKTVLSKCSNRGIRDYIAYTILSDILNRRGISSDHPYGRIAEEAA